MKMVKYDVWDYEVWGNEGEGFTVNDRRCFQRDVEFPTTHQVYNEGTDGEFSDEWPTNEQIIQTLKDIGFLSNDANIDMVDIDGEPEYTLYLEDSSNAYPIGELCFVE